MENTTFETGNIYTMKFAGNADLKIEYICTKRTAKFITFERFQKPQEGELRLKAFTFEGAERVREGNYTGAGYICCKKFK